MLSGMNSRMWMLLVCLAMVPACGSNEVSSLDASGTAPAAGDAAANDYASDRMETGGDSGRTAYQDANLLDATVDASIVDAPRIDSAVMDAGECRADLSELSTQGWIRPCASLVDAGVPSPTCIGQSPGLYLFRATCEQRETWLWSYGGTHSQECFYDHGALVGARLQNDTPAFCGNMSNVLLIGVTEGCTAAPAALVLNCNPFVDADWKPWAADAL
jgi:hypothetical protein